jgi:cation diffusion facilitator family transporter
VRRVLGVTLALNLGVAAAKLAVGWWTGSLAMVADGFHSLTDTASNVVGLLGIAVAARPPDSDHPYGHRKFETLSALAIGGFLALTAWEVLRSCVVRFQSGSVPEVTRWSFAVMVATMAVNAGVSAWERRRAEALGSLILEADAAHTRSDVYVSLAVLVSLLGVHWGYPRLDLVAALAITVVIARAAVRIVWRSAEHLVDTAAVPPAKVLELALSVPEVEGIHKVRTRGRPEDGQADLHVQVRADLTIDEAHRIGHQVVDLLREELGLSDVVVHVEPAGADVSGRGPAGGRRPAG